jgi:hypothetical protein
LVASQAMGSRWIRDHVSGAAALESCNTVSAALMSRRADIKLS